MKKKINSSILLISIISMLLSTIIISSIFYLNHLNTEKEYIKEYALTLYESIGDSNDKIYSFNNTNYRLTIIQDDGSIFFDSFGDIEENHKNRKEFIKATDSGFGEDTRVSQTLNKNLYYYSILMENGSVFRVSSHIDSFFNILVSIMPSIVITGTLIIFLSFIISNILGKNILKPIDKLTTNMELLTQNSNFDTVDIYDELIPLVSKIGQQSYEINKQIDNIKSQKNLLDTIIYNMSDGIILIDKNKKIITMNQSSISLLKNNTDNKNEFINKYFIEFNRNQELNKNISSAMSNKHNIKYFQNILNKHLYISINPILKNDKVYALTILIMDYTNKYNLEQNRREFAANVSHELKTPLTSINGYAELISSNIAKGDDIQKFARIIKSEGDRLLEMIDSIIKISKLESNNTFKDFKNIDLLSITKDITNSMEILSQNKNITIEIKGQATFIKGNLTMIQDCIYNLIDNAIKYNIPNGFIYININTKDDIPSISIKDTGIGIPYDRQERIFERFYIVDDSRNKKTQSTGLGLSIVKHILDYHNANIKLNSVPNKGTEFILYFPED